MSSLKWNKDFALEQTLGDEELLDELITLFKDSSESDYQQLKDAIAAKDSGGVVAAAHSLKGASASLGIEAIRELAMVIETQGREGDLSGLAAKGDAMGELLKELAQL